LDFEVGKEGEGEEEEEKTEGEEGAGDGRKLDGEVIESKLVGGYSSAIILSVVGSVFDEVGIGEIGWRGDRCRKFMVV
jgi:hypothetical protein